MREKNNTSARFKDDINQIVYSDDLTNLYISGNLDKETFICLGCIAQSIPCSYKPENKRRPYYKILQHDKYCDVYEYQELIKTGKTKKISSESGFPVPYPSKLYLIDKNKNKKIKSDVEESLDQDLNTVKKYKKNNEIASIDKLHHRTSSTIRPIVQHFINFPFDRDLSLDMPMLSYDTYHSVFRKISTYKINNEEFKEKYSEQRLYYAELSLESNSIKKEENHIILKFFNKFKNITLNIDISDWSDRKVSEVMNELEDLQKETKEQYSLGLKKIMKTQNKAYEDIKYKERKKIKTNKITIFFIGNLSEENYTFQLYKNDFRLYYAEFM